MNLPSVVFAAPGIGFNRNIAYQMIAFGRALRDQHLWQFPLLPGAVFIYQQMVAGREFKVSGSDEKGVARAVEWINNAQSINHDGTTDYGFEQHLKRRVLDNLCIGRTTFHWKKNKPLRYIDPSNIVYDLEDKVWINKYTEERYKPQELMFDHPIPIGSDGLFVSPLSHVMPTAALAWLIREHDKSSADGRKIRDILLVKNKSLAESLRSAIKQSLELWAGADPTKHSVPIAFIEGGMPDGLAMEDMFATLGLASIPKDLDRAKFWFMFANETSNATGLALRAIWNAEEATNRALEEVQQQRQTQKGPAAFIRTEQRLINASGALSQFGAGTRMGFIEETDLESRKVNAEVLKLYAESLMSFAQVFGGNVNGDAFLAWLQSVDILPADLDLVTDLGTIQNPDILDTPQGNVSNQDSEKQPTRLPTPERSERSLDYGEISMDSNGRIVERRHKVINIEKILENRLRKDVEIQTQTIQFHRPDNSFASLLKEARIRNYSEFLEIIKLEKHFSLDTDEQKLAAEIAAVSVKDLTDVHHRTIKMIVHRIHNPIDEMKKFVQDWSQEKTPNQEPQQLIG